jgi:hypothetical protein
MMVSNLIRSVHLFSKHPIIVYVVDTVEISVDWDPLVFPRLIVIHANGIAKSTISPGASAHTVPVSFNFEKFRSMMLRIKIGVQLDADMINGPNCDKLFDATERESTAQYPYPILPVHWMSRYKERGQKIDGYPMYATSYPGDGTDGKGAGESTTTAKQFPPRDRWAHAHPTWTFHALPFMLDALTCKLWPEIWESSPRVIEAMGGIKPLRNPVHYMQEDEDLLNILLWRYKKHKQWCKWDLEPNLYEQFIHNQNNIDGMSDTRFYPDGVPLVFLSMHVHSLLTFFHFRQKCRLRARTTRSMTIFANSPVFFFLRFDHDVIPLKGTTPKTRSKQTFVFVY